jgi:ribosomal protein S18 acetylase RimI-like enzyme
MKEPYHIVKTSALTPQQRFEVESLAQVCREREGLELPLEIAPVPTTPEGGANQILCYRGSVLVGFMGLAFYDEIEVVGMVHPDQRRKGVGRTLMEVLKDECQLRGASCFLLVCEAVAQGGARFAEALGGEYRFSEYRMELRPANFHRQPPQGKPLMLRRAGMEEVDTLLFIQTAAFGRAEDKAHERLIRWFQEANQRFYLGVLNGKPIGMLRVSSVDTTSEPRTVYINSFGVLPETQGLGYGRQILSETVAELLAEGWEHIRIEVNVENRNALSLYKSCGFEEMSEYQYYEVGLF